MICLVYVLACCDLIAGLWIYHMTYTYTISRFVCIYIILYINILYIYITCTIMVYMIKSPFRLTVGVCHGSDFGPWPPCWHPVTGPLKYVCWNWCKFCWDVWAHDNVGGLSPLSSRWMHSSSTEQTFFSCSIKPMRIWIDSMASSMHMIRFLLISLLPQPICLAWPWTVTYESGHDLWIMLILMNHESDGGTIPWPPINQIALHENRFEPNIPMLKYGLPCPVANAWGPDDNIHLLFIVYNFSSIWLPEPPLMFGNVPAAEWLMPCELQMVTM